MHFYTYYTHFIYVRLKDVVKKTGMLPIYPIKQGIESDFQFISLSVSHNNLTYED